MRLSIIGCGYLGTVHAAAMADMGHDVIGIDVDLAKIAQLSAGTAPFFEPGLPEILTRAAATGRLRFSTDISEAAGYDVHFIAVGTPQQAGSHRADLRYVRESLESLRPYLSEGDVVVGKSTVPVGTAAELAATLEGTGATLAWNPEFLREGFAVKDTLHPDRIVYGLPDGAAGEHARAVLDEVYAAPIAEGIPVIGTDYATAELVKVSANAFLATKISFINAMAEIAEATGADVAQLADAIGHDARIGRRFLNAGLGFGGGCLPKDIRAFQARAEELDLGDSIAFLGQMDAINLRRRDHVVELAQRMLAEGGRVAVLGLAFKPNSDDVRDSPGLDVARRLHEAGIPVRAFDPEARANASRLVPGLEIPETLEDTVAGADLIIIATEWEQFRALNPVTLSSAVSTPAIIDARNCLDAEAWIAAGWTYRGMGRYSER